MPTPPGQGETVPFTAQELAEFEAKLDSNDLGDWAEIAKLKRLCALARKAAFVGAGGWGSGARNVQIVGGGGFVTAYGGGGTFATRFGGGGVATDWSEVTRQLGERMAKIEADQTAILRRVSGPRVRLPEQAPEPTLSDAEKPEDTDRMSFAEIGKSPGFKQMMAEADMRDAVGSVAAVNWLREGDRAGAAPVAGTTRTSPVDESVSCYAMLVVNGRWPTRQEEQAWQVICVDGIVVKNAFGPCGKLSVVLGPEPGSFISFGLDYWERLWADHIPAPVPLSLEGCMVALTARREADQREAAVTFEAASQQTALALSMREQRDAAVSAMNQARAELSRWGREANEADAARVRDDDALQAQDEALMKQQNRIREALRRPLGTPWEQIVDQVLGNIRTASEHDALVERCEKLAAQVALDTPGFVPFADFAQERAQKNAALAGLANVADALGTPRGDHVGQTADAAKRKISELLERCDGLAAQVMEARGERNGTFGELTNVAGWVGADRPVICRYDRDIVVRTAEAIRTQIIKLKEELARAHRDVDEARDQLSRWKLGVPRTGKHEDIARRIRESDYIKFVEMQQGDRDWLASATDGDLLDDIFARLGHADRIEHELDGVNAWLAGNTDAAGGTASDRIRAALDRVRAEGRHEADVERAALVAKLALVREALGATLGADGSDDVVDKARNREPLREVLERELVWCGVVEAISNRLKIPYSVEPDVARDGVLAAISKLKRDLEMAQDDREQAEEDAEAGAVMIARAERKLAQKPGPIQQAISPLASEQILDDVIRAVMSSVGKLPTFEIKHRAADADLPPRTELHVREPGSSTNEVSSSHVLAYVELGELWLGSLNLVGDYVKASVCNNYGWHWPERIRTALAR